MLNQTNLIFVKWYNIQEDIEVSIFTIYPFVESSIQSEKYSRINSFGKILGSPLPDNQILLPF